MALELIVMGDWFFYFFLNWRCFDDVRLGEDNTKACHNCINLPAKYNVDRH